MSSFLIIYALFLFAVACFLWVLIQVDQRYNNFQLIELLAEGARICRTFPTDTFLRLHCTNYGADDEIDYYFAAHWVGANGRRQFFASDSLRADAQHQEVNDILRNFLKSVEEHQSYN